MNTEEVGAYILLLCKAWRENPPGSLPDDDCVLARWARLTPERWSVCRTSVLAPFTLGTDSRWHQKRLRREYERLMARKRENQKAAKSRWSREVHANALPKQSLAVAVSVASANKEKSKPLAAKPPKRGSQLPEDFRLTDEMRYFAGRNARAAEEEFEAFCDFHRSKGSVFKDWQAAWRTWVRNAVKFSNRGGSNGKQHAAQIEAHVGSGPELQQSFCAKCGRTKAFHKRQIANILREEPTYQQHEFIAEVRGDAAESIAQ